MTWSELTTDARSHQNELKTDTMADFDEQIRKAIPAEFHMISGSGDSQTSADVQNVGQFALPNPAGRAGGACTSALLQVLYKDGLTDANGNTKTWVQLLREMRTVLLRMGFDQIPQLTSSRMVDVEKPMYIVPPSFNPQVNRKRAVIIGIKYVVLV
jgi:metacaspase-1